MVPSAELMRKLSLGVARDESPLAARYIIDAVQTGSPAAGCRAVVKAAASVSCEHR